MEIDSCPGGGQVRKKFTEGEEEDVVEDVVEDDVVEDDVVQAPKSCKAGEEVEIVPSSMTVNEPTPGRTRFLTSSTPGVDTPKRRMWVPPRAL